MDWVLNNLDTIIIPIIIAVLYLVGNSAQKKAAKDKQSKSKQQQEADPNEARRVAEIQEEIRRKIAERSGRTPRPVHQAPSAPMRPPVGGKSVPKSFRTSPQKSPPTIPQPVRKPTPAPTSPPTFQAELYQRDIEAKMKKVRELEARVKAKSMRNVWGQSTTQKAPQSKLQRELFKDLSHPLGQRKAILVSEILGSPVGIKGPSQWKSNM